MTIFLAILSGAVIAVALVTQADPFGPAFISIAIRGPEVLLEPRPEPRASIPVAT